MVSGSDNIKHLCFSPDHRGQYFMLSPLSMMLAIDFFVNTLYQTDNVPFICHKFY